MKLEKFFHGNGLKIVAGLMAVAIWLGVSAERREQTFERAFEVPVALVGIRQDVIVMTPIQDVVNVRLRGPVSALRSLSSQNLEVTIDMRDSKPGVARMLIRPQALNLPPNVEVVSINPATLTFRLEARRNKEVPIRPYLVGQLPPGYTYEGSEIRVEPKTALVSGPASSIREFDVVFTERIVLSGRTTSFRQTVGVVSDVPLVKVVEPVSAVVDVIVYPPPPLQLPSGSGASQSGGGE
jgi:YbbR domain-containing protein